MNDHVAALTGMSWHAARTPTAPSLPSEPFSPTSSGLLRILHVIERALSQPTHVPQRQERDRRAESELPALHPNAAALAGVQQDPAVAACATWSANRRSCEGAPPDSGSARYRLRAREPCNRSCPWRLRQCRVSVLRCDDRVGHRRPGTRVRRLLNVSNLPPAGTRRSASCERSGSDRAGTALLGPQKARTGCDVRERAGQHADPAAQDVGHQVDAGQAI